MHSHKPDSPAFNVTHRLVLSIALPMTLGYLTTPLIGLTDTAVVGRLGDAAALAGLAIGALLFDLLYGSLSFLRTATTGLVAQAFGRGDAREEQAVFWRALLSSLGLGVLMLALAPAIIHYAPSMIASDAAVISATQTYFTIRVLTSPATFANFVILGFVLGRGEGVLGLKLQILLNGCNILLTLLLGLGLGWGVQGVALGTAGAELIAAAAGLLIIIRRYRTSPLRPSRAEILDPSRFKALFRLNGDILIRSLVLNAAFALMARLGGGQGAVTLAANAVLMNVFMLASFFLDGLAGAAEQLTGRSVGAGSLAAFRRAVLFTGGWSLAISLVIAAVFMVIGDPLIRLLTTSPDVRQMAGLYLPWAALTAVTGAIAFQMDGVFIGATWSREMRNMMLLAFIGYCVSLAALVPLFGNHGLWVSLHLFLLCRGGFLAAMLPARVRRSFRT
jgi:putative MATE family efflux protein